MLEKLGMPHETVIAGDNRGHRHSKLATNHSSLLSVHEAIDFSLAKDLLQEVIKVVLPSRGVMTVAIDIPNMVDVILF